MNPRYVNRSRFNSLVMIGLGLLALFMVMPAAVGHT